MTDTQTPDKRDENDTQVELKIDTTENQDDQKDIITLPGKHLRRVREENNMSAKQVADSLHLEVRIIETLEADDYESGIPTIFMKGYIRNYAKLLDIDPEPLIVAFDAANKSDETETESKSKSKSKAATQKTKYKPKKQADSNDLWPKLVTLAILLTLIIFIALWQFSPQNDKAATNDQTSSKYNIDLPLNQPQSMTENHETSSGDETQTQIPTTFPSSSSEETKTVEQQSMATPSEPTPPVAAPVESQDHSIHVNFKARVWMRITDSTGKKLFQGTGTEGKSLTLEGTPPYKIRVGNHNNVDIEYQGTTKDVKEYPKYKNQKMTFIVGGE